MKPWVPVSVMVGAIATRVLGGATHLRGLRRSHITCHLAQVSTALTRGVLNVHERSCRDAVEDDDQPLSSVTFLLAKHVLACACSKMQLLPFSSINFL